MTRLIQVIQSDEKLVGNGKTTPVRRVVQYHTPDGKLLVEVDSAAVYVTPEMIEKKIPRGIPSEKMDVAGWMEWLA